jgi:hypothetical protein
MKREVYKTFRVNEEEDKIIREKAERCNLSQAALIRMLALGFIPGEAPPEEFYEKMDELNREGVKLERLVAKANAMGFTDCEELKKVFERIDELTMEIKQRFTRSDDKPPEEVNADE